MVSKNGELYFNEINPIPGSFGFFLWEAAKGEAHIGFTGQLTAMLEEARAQVRKHHRTIDPTASGGQIFSRRG
jgi:D-alanine-D-alanine ligase